MTSSGCLEEKKLVDCVEYLGRGQSPSYFDGESGVFAINQKCIRNGAVDVSHARAHHPNIGIRVQSALQEGDICVNSTGTGTIGRVGLWIAEGLDPQNKYFVDSHVTIVRPHKAEISSKYLAALLESHPIQVALETYCFSGSTNQVELNRSALCNLTIGLLPKAEQNTIAAILSTIDKAIAQTEALIAKQQRIKTGLMQDLLTRGIDEHGAIRSEATHAFKDSPLGRIPVEWEEKRLAQVFAIKPKNGIYKPAHEIGSGCLLVGQTSFTEENTIDYSLSRRCAINGRELETYGLCEKDLLISRVFATVEGVGRAIYVSDLPEEAVYESNMLRLRIDEQIVLPKLVFYWLQSFPIRSRIMASVNASNQTSINQQVLNALPIVVARRNEQEKVVLILDQEEASLAKTKDLLNKLRKQKNGLMQDLLTGKVRVNELLKSSPHG